MREKTFSFLLLMFLVFVSLAFNLQKEGWKGTVEYEDGVNVIINPKKPLYGKIVFDLEEDLSIGRVDNDNYLFYRVRDIEVDNQGNIYVGDMSNFRVQKFNKNGKYIQTIGRQGQGPGEFERPTKIRILEISGNIYVQDRSYNIVIFDKQGNYLREIIVKKSIMDFGLDDDGNIIGVFGTLSGLDYTHSICKVNLMGEIIKNVAEFPNNEDIRRGPVSTIVGSYSGLEKNTLISTIDEKNFIFGYPETYELSVIDKKGQLLFKIRKDEPLHKFPPEERGIRKERIYGIYQPFFYLILTDTEGRFYVQTNKTWNEDNVKEKHVDIFNKDGYYLYKTTLPKYTYVIKNGYLYALKVSDDEIIKRYKIKNWDQIKERIE